MVLEALINPVKAENRPIQMFLLGLLYASVAMGFSLWIFFDYSSLVAVFLTVFASVPIIYNTIKLEEKKDEENFNEYQLLGEHWKALKVFIWLFVGFAVAFALWYIILPNDFNQVLFSTQTETFHTINSGAVGMVAKVSEFAKVLFNNLKVLMFCLLFSFVYGLGAIFILVWNASVIGAAIGMFIRNNLAKVASEVGLVKVSLYLQIFTIGFLKYSLHGVLEILAYFMGGLAGGIISIAILKHGFGTNKFEKILIDVSDLIVISVMVLVVAATIEVYITPIVF